MKSREIEKKIPFRKMVIPYPGLHTVDEEMATDILCEDYHLEKMKPKKKDDSKKKGHIY